MTPGHRSRFVNHAVQPPVIRISFDAEELPMSPDTVDNLKWVEQANAVQAPLPEARSRSLGTELTATASRVTVNPTATGTLREIRFDASTVQDRAELRRDILAAHQHATSTIQELAQDMMRPTQEMVGRLEGGEL
jgi:DNA-binding protein YbaB